MDPIYQKARALLNHKNAADGTVYRYLRNIRRFEEHCSPLTLHDATREQVLNYLLLLRERSLLTPATVKNHQAALLFLFDKVLNKPEVMNGLPWPKVPTSFPTVWSSEEVGLLLEHIHNLKYRTMTLLMYGTGMRISEVITLQIAHIDGASRQIHIHNGKGEKDRLLPISETLRQHLRTWYKAARPSGPYLFPGQGGKFVNRSTLQEAIKKAGERSPVNKAVYPHLLRHSYATTLLELGVDIRTIQLLLGHSSIQTTARYLHMTLGHLQRIPTPSDLIEVPRARRES